MIIHASKTHSRCAALPVLSLPCQEHGNLSKHERCTGIIPLMLDHYNSPSPSPSQKPLSATLLKGRSFVREINESFDVESYHRVVRKHSAICSLWFFDNHQRTRLVKEHVVYQARPPSAYSMRSAVTFVSY